MKHDTDLWLGDLLRAFEALQPGDEATRALLAAMTGMAWLPRVTPADGPPGTPTPAPAVGAPPAAGADGPPAAPVALEPAEPPDLLPWTRRDDTQRQADWNAVPALEPYASGGEGSTPHLPLFRPEWSRVLASSLAGTELPIGPIDSARLVDTVARGLPVQRITRLPTWSLGLGLQLLIDESAGMEPFGADQIEFSARLRECVGAAHLQELSFADCPTRGVFMDGGLERYPWPDPGVPVLALSHVGIGGPPADLQHSRAAEWLDFAARLRTRGTSLRVLVPHARSRWPAALRDGLVMVEWDRGTTSGAVRHRLAAGG